VTCSSLPDGTDFPCSRDGQDGPSSAPRNAPRNGRLDGARDAVGSVPCIDANRRDALINAFTRFLPPEDRERYPTYWAICQGVASDNVLLELAEVVPPPQLPVNVFLASVHDLLLRGAEHDLAHRYRSVCRRRALPYAAVEDGRLQAEFASFCGEFHDEIARRCAVRATQTNEVGRSAVLRAALASTDAGPVGLLDAGCSAGLNLLVDAYRVEYGRVAVGPPAGPVLRCELRGALPPLELPAIRSRVGLDLAPLDVADPDDRAWLLACIWPDDLERFERFEAAAAIATARRDEITLRRGDMVDDLGAAAAEVDAPHLVVLTSWAAPYLPRNRRGHLTEAVAGVAATRPTTWIAMEFPSVLHDLALVERDLPVAQRAASVVCVTTFDPTRSSRVVAETHHHGRWLDWRA